MLVLTRKLGESVIINDEAVTTVAVVGREFVELVLTRLDGSPMGTATIGTKGLNPIFAGTQGVVVRVDSDKVRLGIEIPPGGRVDRQESWGVRRQF